MMIARKMTLIAALLAALSLPTTVAAADFGLDTIQNAVDGFSTKILDSLPLAANVGLNWSDAYIGKLLGVPPHFGVGLTVGFATLDTDAFKKLAAAFGASELGIGLVPAYVLEGRIGGFILPFDLGVKFGFLPDNTGFDLGKGKLGLDYLLVGADLRYALLEGNLILPKLSVGFGYSYLKGGITAPLGSGVEFGVPNTTYSIAASDPTLHFLWESQTAELKVEASKSFLIITPYLGMAAGIQWSNAGYKLDSKITYSNSDQKVLIDEAMKTLGVNGITSAGFSSIKGVDAGGDGSVYYRAFGGASVNMAIIRADITLMCLIPTHGDTFTWGATIGARIQL
jgi:hypothetical protein